MQTRSNNESLAGEMGARSQPSHGRLTPFMKWAGGKRWLVEQELDLFPSSFRTYLEPFLGGAAVYFHLRPKSAILSDVNQELIDTYVAIKTDWRLVLRYLREHQRNHSKDYYYKIRASSYRSLFTRAARVLYLNRTCWNGLYRVNLKGEFNVPIGTKTDVLLGSDDFPRVAELLGGARIICNDFEETINMAKSGDFVFVDPPYTVKHNFNGFIKYNEKLFAWEDQIRLRDAIVRAAERGAKVLVLNAAHDSIRDLYSDFYQIELSRSSKISGKPEYRGTYAELAVKCW